MMKPTEVGDLDDRTRLSTVDLRLPGDVIQATGTGTKS